MPDAACVMCRLVHMYPHPVDVQTWLGGHSERLRSVNTSGDGLHMITHAPRLLGIALEPGSF